MRSRKIASIKARSAEVEIHAAVDEQAQPPRSGVMLVVPGWSAPPLLTAEETAALCRALTDVAARASRPDPVAGGEGPWTAAIELSGARKATVGYVGELQEGDRPEVFLSVGTEGRAAVTKEIVWLSPEAALELAREMTRAASS